MRSQIDLVLDGYQDCRFVSVKGGWSAWSPGKVPANYSEWLECPHDVEVSDNRVYRDFDSPYADNRNKPRNPCTYTFACRPRRRDP